MADPPSALTIFEIWKFLKYNNHRATNHSLVTHFKPFLTDSDTRDAARDTFKQYVNILATIKKDNNKKYIVLKDEYIDIPPPDSSSLNISQSSKNNVSVCSVENVPERTPPPYELIQPPPYRPNKEILKSCEMINAPERNLRPNFINISESDSQSNYKRMPEVNEIDSVRMLRQEDFQPPPYRPVPEPPTPQQTVSPILMRRNNNIISSQPLPERNFKTEEDDFNDNVSEHNFQPPSQPVHKWSAKIKPPEDQNDNISQSNSITSSEEKENLGSGSMTSLTENEQKLSVKECMKKFNKAQPDGAHVFRQSYTNRKTRGGDDDDKTSVSMLDQESHVWITTASRCEYSYLSKMLTENIKLLTVKDPILGYTALHWAAKRGDENLVKLLAGANKKLVNTKSVGGYTPLHLATQFGHESIYKLLKDVYGADIEIRDYSGRRAIDYPLNNEVIISPDSYRKNKHKKKNSEKDLGFLRIGSLNMRVKKTTEAFSNFLGVGPSRGVKPPIYTRYNTPVEILQAEMSEESIRKSWGSADNIGNDKTKMQMPPPLFTKIKRKKKLYKENSSPSLQSRSTPSTPNEVRSVKDFDEDGISNATVSSESESDTACGFDASWQQK